MKLAIFAIALLGLAALTGCSTRIEERPIEIVESAAVTSIEEAGADPGDWRVEGSCVAQGPCRVDVYKRDGEFVVSNRYTVKDSRATVNGDDRIRTTVARMSGS